jgi:tripartite-type tricarboxylate transporter receptor subunit TctC
MKKTTKSCLLGIAVFLTAALAHAQPYPNKPIKLIVPVAAGGVTDLMGRELADMASSRLGQPVVIENRGGANATLGAVQMMSADPSGYSLSMFPIGVFRMPHITGTVFDPLKDFTYISTIAGYNYYIAVEANSPWKSIADLAAYAKTGGVVTYGTPGPYSSQHIAGAQLGVKAGGEWTHIPYKGDSELIAALLGGQIKAVVSASSIIPYVEAGKIRVLATLGSKRTADLPNVPTLQELGYSIVHTSSLGIAGPKGMPKEVVEKLEKVFKDIYTEKRYQDVLVKYGMSPQYMDSKAYTAYAIQTFNTEKASLKEMGVAVK